MYSRRACDAQSVVDRTVCCRFYSQGCPCIRWPLFLNVGVLGFILECGCPWFHPWIPVLVWRSFLNFGVHGFARFC